MTCHYTDLNNWCFWLPEANFPRGTIEQKHNPYLGSDGSSVWNFCAHFSTGSPSSKYEYRRTSALLRNIRNIRICMRKTYRFCNRYENERISIKNSLPYLKCVLRLSRVVHGQIYGRFIGFYVNGFFYATMTMFADAHISSLGYLWSLTRHFTQGKPVVASRKCRPVS